MQRDVAGDEHGAESTADHGADSLPPGTSAKPESNANLRAGSPLPSSVRKMLSSSSARKRLRSLSTRRPSTQAHPGICPMGNREATEWGMPSVVDAERRLLANALLDLDNERFVLVSESCIPLHPLATVHAYLTRSAHSFVAVVDDPGRDGLGRYPAGLAPEVPVSRWRKGTQWFELHRSLAVFVVADGRYYPRFREECLPRCYVDEHYLPTVLTMEEPGSLANRSVTLVDWSRGGAHPARFGARDVGEEFLERLAGKKEKGSCMYNGQPVEVCFLFARKFAPDALQKLLQLSPRILGY